MHLAGEPVMDNAHHGKEVRPQTLMIAAPNAESSSAQTAVTKFKYSSTSTWVADAVASAVRKNNPPFARTLPEDTA
jgi:poly-beta-hydroxyalkanoate depolymerase